MPKKPHIPTKEIIERNSKIMAVVGWYRRAAKITQRDCGLLLNTDEHTYNLMENGSTYVLAAELDLLMDYLEIPISALWPSSDKDPSAHIQSIDRSPNGTLQITIDIDPGRLLNRPSTRDK